ncbi:hypothetical protein N0V83_000535 [Neocucurbitaria cava]|uniref:Sphingoid long-chain base transporter RSB1 n=1 Tax=Neocucurbitaria cava TaxID=798079 RepID=A0A9W9CR97_9PLEO|nr:hypothetical protein N0V83_000535 [Neocucurbitaria cava]
MGAPPRPDVPEWCKSVTTDCPVAGTVYGYAPSLSANTFFASFFGLALLLQLYLGIRYKTWTYMIAVSLGCLAECIGYVGRIMMSNNPYDDLGFKIQIVLLIFAPAFLAAGIYLTLRRNRLTHNALVLWDNRRFKFFCGAVVVAYVTILIRCIYRIPELLGGWGGELMRVEVDFIILESAMIVLTVVAQTVFHPGFCFSAMANTIGKKHQHSKLASMSETELEMLGRGESA